MKNMNSGQLPVGTIVAFVLSPTKNNLPDGWLLCDGSPIPAQYQELRTLYGSSTPNFAGRTLIGSGSPNKNEAVNGQKPKYNTNFPTTINFKLGDNDGEFSHQLTQQEMPVHNHNSDNSQVGENDGSNVFIVGHATTDTAKAGNVFRLGGGLGPGVYWQSAGSTNCTDVTGNDIPHNNMQPYYVVHYIIYAGN